MAFNWREFFLLAHELRKETQESKRRTSIGRAYYYVYNIALVEAQKRGYSHKMPLLEHFHVNCNQLWKFSADANAEDVFR